MNIFKSYKVTVSDTFYIFKNVTDFHNKPELGATQIGEEWLVLKYYSKSNSATMQQENNVND